MNETVKRLYERKSVRVYSDKVISEEDKNTILECALAAPSAGNLTLYTIIDITDDEIKKSLAVSCDNQPFIAKAPMLLLFVADYKRLYDAILTEYPSARTPAHGDMFLAYADALIAAQNAVVAADALGIGSCYIGDIIENCGDIIKLFSLPRYTMPAALLCFGYPSPSQIKRKKPKRCGAADITCKNVYSATDAHAAAEMLAKKDTAGRGTRKIIEDIYNRKYSAAYSLEMSESVRRWIGYWVSGKTE